MMVGFDWDWEVAFFFFPLQLTHREPCNTTETVVHVDTNTSVPLWGDYVSLYVELT